MWQPSGCLSFLHRFPVGAIVAGSIPGPLSTARNRSRVPPWPAQHGPRRVDAVTRRHLLWFPIPNRINQHAPCSRVTAAGKKFERKPSMIDFSQPEVTFALDAVRKAGRLAQRIQNAMVVEGVAKSDMSPVTVADYALQALVAKALKDCDPDAALVGEESAADLRREEGGVMRALVTEYVGKVHPGAAEEEVCTWIDRGAAEPGARFWTLDPVDGTKGYLRGEQYAVALALIEAGQVIIGALCCPNLSLKAGAPAGTVLLAQRGKGAWRANMTGGDTTLTQVHVSTQTDPRQARLMRSVEAGHTNIGEIDHLASALQVEAAPVCMDSQAKYAVLAAGGGEMLFRLLSPAKPDYKERIWDQAAGSIVLEEAGGQITDLYGRPLDFSQGRTLAGNTGVFASNGALHAAGLEAIASVCKLP